MAPSTCLTNRATPSPPRAREEADTIKKTRFFHAYDEGHTYDSLKSFQRILRLPMLLPIDGYVNVRNLALLHIEVLENTICLLEDIQMSRTRIKASYLWH
jgi:hypothetical protein